MKQLATEEATTNNTNEDNLSYSRAKHARWECLQPLVAEESGYETFACPLKRPCKSLSAGEFKKCIPKLATCLPAGILASAVREIFVISGVWRHERGARRLSAHDCGFRSPNRPTGGEA
jgi:hypothetical protein